MHHAADGLAVDQAVALMGSDDAVALVAEADGEVVGMGLGAGSAPVGWVYRVAVLPRDAPDEGVAGQLLERLERELADRGARKLATLVRRGDPAQPQFVRRGYRASDDVVWLERDVPRAVPVPPALEELGARFIEPGLWEELKGLEDAKQVIERRVILPLAESELAARHGVRPPKAIVLFGPPGTGKTTFAKGIASRLGWPFAEIEPGELAAEGPDRQATLLGETFSRILELPSAVVFVDEVEDVAATRTEERRVSPSITNEFLRQIPRMRGTVEHLLICATNWVGHLDPAFLRPGRFDYVLPVGPPDAAARGSIWRRYLDEITDEEVDVPALVEASELFTPADIEFAARKAAQQAFEREHVEGIQQRATTDDFLRAIRATRPTLTEEIVDVFERDTRRFARF